MFLEISRNSLENTCARVSFLMKACNFIKKETLAQVFSFEFCKFLRTPFLQNTSRRLLLYIILFSSKTKHFDRTKCRFCFVRGKLSFGLKNTSSSLNYNMAELSNQDRVKIFNLKLLPEILIQKWSFTQELTTLTNNIFGNSWL